ncbi:MAG: copper chaperone PCu(A)C [Gemmatimonadaceae bacterium]|nr:copper chaperone PCu(A)C [Gemmatimonadaceae bacterium]
MKTLAVFAVAGLVACAPSEPRIVVTDAVVVVPAGDAPAALYLTIENTGGAADTLRAITTERARTVSLHTQASGMGAMTHMVAMPALAVPAHGRIGLRPGAEHGMVEGLTSPLLAGDSVSFTMHFARSGTQRVSARAVPYAALDSLFPPRR